MRTFIATMARFKLWLVFEGLYESYLNASPKQRRDFIHQGCNQNIPLK